MNDILISSSIDAYIPITLNNKYIKNYYAKSQHTSDVLVSNLQDQGISALELLEQKEKQFGFELWIELLKLQMG